MLSYMSCLYILSINLLLVILLANIFSHSVGCLFALLMVSLAVQKVLSFMRSHWFIFVLIFFTLGNRSKKNRGHAGGQQAHEKMLSITNHQGNANQNHIEISPHTHQNVYHQM